MPKTTKRNLSVIFAVLYAVLTGLFVAPPNAIGAACWLMGTVAAFVIAYNFLTIVQRVEEGGGVFNPWF